MTYSQVLSADSPNKRFRPSMEFVVTKRHGKCKRKRRLKALKKRQRERIKREVRSARLLPECNVTDARETLATGTMQADAFWKNYAVAQEWQKR